MTADRYYPGPVWWVDADACAIDVAPPGTVAGDGTVGDETYALILSGDSSYAIEGTRDELLQLLATCKQAIQDDVPVEEPERPKLGETYYASQLPAGSVVRTTTSTEYVIGRSGLCMRWEQPIPGSDGWQVEYVGRLADGDWMTPRERAEVDEGRSTR